MEKFLGCAFCTHSLPNEDPSTRNSYELRCPLNDWIMSQERMNVSACQKFQDRYEAFIDRGW